MTNYHENFVVYRGRFYTVYFHAETKDSSSVHDYFESCDGDTQARLLHLAKMIAETGRIYDETKFRIEDSKNKIYCFKPKAERFFSFFFTGRKIIITSAYSKERQKLDRKELKKAINIRREYFS